MSFEALRLVCPRCRRLGPEGELVLSTIVEHGTGCPAVLGQLQAEALCCSDAQCQALYPVVQGIPVVFSDPEALSLSHSPPFDALSLPPLTLKALLASSNPASALPTLMARLARYIRAAFSDWLPDSDPDDPLGHLRPHAVQLMDTLQPYEEACLTSTDARLVLGCALGREAWEVTRNPTLLSDAHLPSLLAAQALLATGTLDFVVPDDVVHWRHCHLEAPRQPRTPVALICCDAQNPPFEVGAFGSVVAPNLIDSVHDPLLMLGQAHALTQPGKVLTISTPFAWRENVTARERWLETVAPLPNMSAEDVLIWFGQHQLEPPVTVLGRTELYWTLRNSKREAVLYKNVAMVLQPGGA